MSALSDFRAAIVTRVSALSGYSECPGGDPTQIPDHWTSGFVVDLPTWSIDGDSGVVVASGVGTVSLWYRTDQLTFEQGAWMSVWEALRAQLEASSWTVSGSARIVVTGADSDRTADRFVGKLVFNWFLTYART